MTLIRWTSFSIVSWLSGLAERLASTRSAYIAGGFKLWECGIDLAKYLIHLWEIKQGTRDQESGFPGKQVSSSHRALELGCGHGLPGIVAAMAGMQIHFQARATAFLVLGSLKQRLTSSKNISINFSFLFLGLLRRVYI